MSVLGVIPARYASTRFEGKVLADINGKPMVQHVYERAQNCSLIDEVIIACDDQNVLEVARGFGANAVMTSVDHQSGSDRIAEAVKDLNVEIVVNIQGDEPLIDPDLIDALVACLQRDLTADIATPIKLIESDEELKNYNVVKVVTDQHGKALYFSREVIPFDRDGSKAERYKHIGLYAYRKQSLLEYTKLPPSILEQTEKLEQLRALEAGMKIITVRTTSESLGVDTLEDLKKVIEISGK